MLMAAVSKDIGSRDSQGVTRMGEEFIWRRPPQLIDRSPLFCGEAPRSRRLSYALPKRRGAGYGPFSLLNRC